MKIQLKRSNVLNGAVAKEPTATQMEYGELAVNYSDGDPAIFLKDSTDKVIRIAGKGATGLDGDYVNITGDTMTGALAVGSSINLDASNGHITAVKFIGDGSELTGLTAPGNGALTIKTAGQGANATGTFTANQGGASTLTLPAIRYTDLSGTPAAPGNGTITVVQPGTSDQTFSVNQTGNTQITLKNDNTQNTPGNGTITIVQPGTTNQTFTVNQGGNKTITLKNDNTQVTPGNGAINVNAGNGLTASGSNATANQSGTTTRTLTVDAADNSISVAAAGISVVDANLTPAWDNITGKPSNLTGAALTSGSYLTGGPYDGSAAKTFNVDATTAATAGKVVARDGNGDINVRYCVGTYMNMNHASSTRNSDTIFYSSTDDYIRKNSASGFRASLNVPTRTGGSASGTWSINISGNATTSSSTSGNAASSTNARVDHDTGNAWHRPVFISDGAGSGSNQRLYSDSASTIGINPSSNQIRATTFVGALSGNATSATSATSATNATNATNFNVAADNSTNSSHYVIFTGGASGNQRPNSDTSLRYNPSTDTLNSTNFNSTSDITLKKDIVSIDSALSRICNIEGVGFAWKDSGARTYGVIAQNVEKEFPELVQTEDFKSVNYNGLVGILIEAIKELKAEVEELKKE